MLDAESYFVREHGLGHCGKLGGKMLPAILSELPVYTLPPPHTGTRHDGATEDGFGPAATVEVRTDLPDALKDSGLYGPDGQFVERAARRETDAARQRTRTESTTSADTRSDRELSLSTVDVAVPPAAREELVQLARKLDKPANSAGNDPEHFEKLARLMERIGRYDDAYRAQVKADTLSHPDKREPAAASEKTDDTARTESSEQ